MTTLRARGLAEDTVRLYRTGVVRFLTEAVPPGTPFSKVTEHHCATFLAGLGNHGPARSKYLHGLRSFFSWAQRRGLVRADPTAELRVRKRKGRPQQALSKEKLFRYIMAAWDDDPKGKRAWAFLACFSLGTRRTELASIQPEDDHGESVLLRRCKGGKQRWVEIGPLARTALDSLRPWHNGTILGGIKPATLTKWAEQAAAKAGLAKELRGRSLHILRASFATHLLREGTPVHVVRDLLGHESIATTNDYAVTFEEDRRRAVRRLDSL